VQFRFYRTAQISFPQDYAAEIGSVLGYRKRCSTVKRSIFSIDMA
jgi:hypothetical protein